MISVYNKYPGLSRRIHTLLAGSSINIYFEMHGRDFGPDGNILLFSCPYSLLDKNDVFDCVHPCSCGIANHPTKLCTCAPAMETKYQKRISGPLLDYIDIHIEVLRVGYEKLSGDRVGESSDSIQARVQAARNIQLQRFSKIESSNIVCNADMRIGEIRQFCKLQDEGQHLMREAMTQLNLSARAYHRILKLARTIADLARCEEIQSLHLAEVIQYRPKLMLN